MEKESVKIIEANIDDLNPQVYEYLLERLLENGALDAYLQNILMKKGRPAIKLSVICQSKDVEVLAKIVFSETTTIGIRIIDAERLKLIRKIIKVKTKYGEIAVKVSESAGIRTITPEYEECKKLAKQKNIPLREVMEAARAASSNL
jgi:pyridinium-3,5-bisthiocarboxylic acid mononucleotide nickel chelatase